LPKFSSAILGQLLLQCNTSFRRLVPSPVFTGYLQAERVADPALQPTHPCPNFAAYVADLQQILLQPQSRVSTPGGIAEVARSVFGERAMFLFRSSRAVFKTACEFF
jgi:hypothetical protein